MEIYFVTSNKDKFNEVQRGIPEILFHQVHLDIDEIQGNIDDIAVDKCLKAYELLKKPTLVDDSSMGLVNFGNYPGPYIKEMYTSLGNKLVTLANTFGNDATATCTLAYMDSSLITPILFKGIIKGKIVSPRGNNGFEWDYIFEIKINSYGKYENKTSAELTYEEKDTYSQRALAINKMRKYFVV